MKKGGKALDGKGPITSDEFEENTPQITAKLKKGETLSDSTFISTARPFDRPTRFSTLRISHDYDEQPEDGNVDIRRPKPKSDVVVDENEDSHVERDEGHGARRAGKIRNQHKSPPSSALYEPSSTLPFLRVFHL